MEHERIIKIKECLSRHANDGVTIKEIQQYLSQNGNVKSVSAVTIRRDIDRLVTLGNHIDVTREAHNTARYKMKNNGFTFNEIRFIVDSVCINKFLSDSQKQHLIKNFEGMCSDDQVRQLTSRICLNRYGTPPANLLDNLEKVHGIISENRKINFEYGKFNSKKQVVYYSKRRDLIPIKVMYFEDRFYLKCLNTETNQIRTYRIDRMKKIKAGEVAKCHPELPKYEGIVLDMFEPEYFESVKFRIKRFLLDDVIERFGKDISVQDDVENPEWVIFRVTIGINQSFYRWVMRHGSNIEIISPEKVRTAFREELKKIFDYYEKNL
jgi:predicted DNA-binding transcriptional regulator YafY